MRDRSSPPELASLMRHHLRTGDPEALATVRATCVRIVGSARYDPLGGGFFAWPADGARREARGRSSSFAKRLDDNALLLGVHAELARADAGARPWAEQVVRETVSWLLDELWTTQAAFASALDGQTEGVEGLTYVWTREQLRQSLGEEDGERAALLLGVTEEGPFPHGASALRLHGKPDDPAWWASVRERLLLRRTLRPQPGRDEEVVTAGNGLAVASLARAGQLLDEPDWVDVAARCARFLLGTHVVDGQLRRSSRDGRVGAEPARAEDRSALGLGLQALHLATGIEAWRQQADTLVRSTPGARGCIP